MSRLEKLIHKHIKSKPEFSFNYIATIQCNACVVKITIRQKDFKYCIDSHEKSARHKEKYAIWILHDRSRIQPVANLLTSARDNKEFNRKVAKAFIAADIPWSKLDNPLLREILLNVNLVFS